MIILNDFLQKVYKLNIVKKKSANIIINVYGLVAQLVEQLTLNQLVVGSSPTGPIFDKLIGSKWDESHKAKLCLV